MKMKKFLAVVAVIMIGLQCIPVSAGGQNSDGTYDYSGAGNPHANDKPPSGGSGSSGGSGGSENGQGSGDSGGSGGSENGQGSGDSGGSGGSENGQGSGDSGGSGGSENGQGSGDSGGSGSSGGSSEPPTGQPELADAVNVETGNIQVEITVAGQPPQDVPAVTGNPVLENQAENTAANVIGTQQQETAGMIQNAAEESQVTQAQETGDPVLLTSGQYVSYETDATIGYGGFPVLRGYRTHNPITGSIGTGWITSLDTRIIRGFDSGIPQKVTSYYQNAVLPMRTYVSNLKKEYVSGHNYPAETDYHQIVTDYKKLIVTWEELLVRAQANTAQAARVRNINSGTKAADISERSLLNAQRIQDSVSETLERYRAELSRCMEQEQLIEQKELLLAKTEETYAQFLKEQEKMNAVQERNQFVNYEGTPQWYRETGFDTLNLIDTKGIIRLYKPTDENKTEWRQVNTVESQKQQIAANGNGFTLSHVNGTNTYYNEWGLYIGETDRNGNSITVNRTENGTITDITTSSGERYTVTYTGNRISSITNGRDPSERVTYTYAGNKLTSVTDVDKDTVHYEYEENRLTKLLKSDGSYVSFTYGMQDAQGNYLTTKTTNEEGFSERFDYDPVNRITTYTTHSGVQTTYRYDEQHRTTEEVHADGSVTQYEYDNLGNLISQILNGDRTTYTYDSKGNRLSAAYSDGSSETWTYNRFSLPISHTDRDGIVETYQRDVKGNLTAYYKGGKLVRSAQYNDKGLVTAITQYGGTTVRTEYEYDSYGNTVKKTTGTKIESWTYDERNRVLSYAINGNTAAVYEYTAKTVTEVRSNGLKTVYTYNGRKDLVSIEQIDTVTGETRVTKYTYDRRHLPVSSSSGDGNTLTETARYLYKPAGEAEADIYSSNNESWITLYTYQNGQRHTIERFKVAGNLPKTITAKELFALKQTVSNVFVQTYDITQTVNGKIAKVTNTLGQITQYKYDNWNHVISITNTLGETSTRSISSGGRLINEQGSHGGVYTYEYDLQGNLTSTGEANSDTVKAEYNADGSIRRVTNRLGEVTEYSYNNRGLVESVKTGTKTDWYTYDNEDRVLSVVTGDTPNKGTAVSYVDYTYSGDGRTVTMTEGGLYKTTYTMNAWNEVTEQLKGDGDTASRRTYTYNAQGNIASFSDGYANKTSYEYNAIGKVSRITYPDGTARTYEYDHLGNVTKITDAEGTVWSGTYDKLGRLVTETGRPGIHKQYFYDALGRITEVKNGGVTVETYSYNERGRTVTVTDGNGSPYTYAKDAFGRLVHETNRLGGSQSYSYDSEGNLARKQDFTGNTTEITYSQGRTVKTVTHSSGEKETFTYDMIGNIIKAENTAGIVTYEYDKGGRLISQYDNASDETVTYTYNSSGTRRKMISTTREVSYSYGKNGETLTIFDNKQRLSVSYKYDTMGREIEKQNGNGITQYTTYDQAGRVVLITEKSSALTGSSSGSLVRGEGYLYDSLGRRSATITDTGAITRYEYNNQGQLSAVYYPDTKELAETQRIEAEHNGLFYKEGSATAVNSFLSGDEYTTLQTLLNRMQNTLGNRLSVLQTFRTEVYTYDSKGNRATKTTPCGTIDYSYDKENRLLSSGWNGQVAVTYTYDANGNLLQEDGRLTVSTYKYNGQNRMVYSRVIDKLQKSAVTTHYEYDAFGRRVIVQEEGSDTMKTLYDGFTFEIVKESPIFANGLFTDKYNTGIQYSTSNTGKPTGDRYRYIEDESDDSRYRYIEDSVYELQTPRFTGNRAVLYGNGSPVAVNRGSSSSSSSSNSNSASSSSTSSGGYFAPTGTRYTNTSYLQDNISYLGTDILGSVRTVTSSYGTVESESTYDVFGTPITGTYTAGIDFGYLRKPYDTATGLYNYGYRDYSPNAARFTTVDPIKDGANWFVYVNNDPVNYVDLWGLADCGLYNSMYSASTGHTEVTLSYTKNSYDVMNVTTRKVNPDGTIDYANNGIKSTNYRATNNVRTPEERGSPVSFNSYNYYPVQFPNGTWSVTPSVAGTNDAEGPLKLRTNANIQVPVFNQDGKLTGEYVTDTGYNIHSGKGETTIGCIKLSDADVAAIAQIVDSALVSGGSATIKVSNGKKNK
ncbi:RHS repeat-associated core domain-containing protein [Treponema brennaborense]|uniref:RHS repeat-associated core domain protein n=1 Tax=Treponema brennaborense (strain DSM 12168 / CIP 105900 / DD5/3) TaxID=906968 RepID=F4LMK5_TREBD|nr:RHS repeat-associated core domain-containing protein [Treponema brennaborense]AEE16752.1 RHS repeat-associated core domain protein [Treponema brennaborense DSM 12168]